VLVVRFSSMMLIFRNVLNVSSNHWLSLTAFLLLLVTALSLWPLPSLPEVPGSDKTHHLMAYAVVAFPVALRSPVRWWLIIVGVVLYGGKIELIQPFVNRCGEWMDFFASTAGVATGVLLGRLVRKMDSRVN